MRKRKPDAPLEIEHAHGLMSLIGALDVDHSRALWRELTRYDHRDRRRHADARLAVVGADLSDSDSDKRLKVDLTRVTEVDGIAVALLVELRSRLAQQRGVDVELAGASEEVAALLKLYGGYEDLVSTRLQGPAAARQGRQGRQGFVFFLFAAIGNATLRGARGSRRMLEFLGDVVRGIFGAIARPVTGNWLATFHLVARAGTDAIGLVLLLNFLLGFVMGYESSRQLERYGAQLFVADVIGIAVTRELSPVMTTIIVLGRSAAAYAAELGTMRVSEELDALRTMGFSPVRHLVVPRIVALVIVTPSLTLLGDVTGVVGGAVVGMTTLDVTPHAYLSELRQAVVVGDVLGGLIKATVAGLVIAVIASQQGFAASGGPAGVGFRTTATVVKSLVALVVIDAFFALLLRVIGT